MYSHTNREFNGVARNSQNSNSDGQHQAQQNATPQMAAWNAGQRAIVKSTRQSANIRLQAAASQQSEHHHHHHGGSAGSSQRAVPTYTSTSLNIGSDYAVYCCYIEDGPNSFYIQLKDTEADLNAMMARIENMPLESLRDRPPMGMACVARYSEDKQLYRAVIMSIKSNACQVLYVDYGIMEMVEFHNIYKVPNEFLDAQTFSLRFTLSGCKQLQPIDEGMKRYFKDLILHKELTIKVMPLEGSPFVQYGELYLDGRNIMDALRKYGGQSLSYGERIHLELNRKYQVIIKYVDTPQKFYVQQVEKLDAFDEMMMDLNKHCKTANQLKELVVGGACAATYEDDNEWCRTEIVEVDGNSNALVRYVDYGGTKNVKQSALRQITPALTEMKPQVIECCLIGFEEITKISKNWRSQLEMLAEDRSRNPKELELQSLGQFSVNSYIVNLTDMNSHPPTHIPSRMYKFCMPLKMFVAFENEMVAKGLCNRNAQRVSSTTSDDSQKHIGASIKSEGGRFVKDNNAFADKHSLTNKRRDAQAIYNPIQKDRSPRNGEGVGKKDFKSTTNPSEWADLAAMQNVESARRSQSSASSNQSSNSPSNSRQPTPTADDMVPYSQQYSSNKFIKYNHQYGVHLTWWISPHEFYVQLKDKDAEFKDMMRQMQIFYSNRPSINATQQLPPIGSSVVVFCQKDQIFYRARIQDYNEKVHKYKVQFVDLGKTTIVTLVDIWRIERRFFDHPLNALQCSLDQIVANYDRAEMHSRVDKYLAGKKHSCLFLERKNNIMTAILEVEKENLRESLINDGIVSAIPSGVDLSRLAGQTVLIQIAFIKNLTCFRVQIFGCDITLICAYKDLKLGKTNTQISSEFQQYEGKTCAATVENVSKDNVLILSPFIPLFTKDEPPLFCDFPILSDNFTVHVIHVESPNVVFVHHSGHSQHLQNLLDTMFEFYDTKGTTLTEFLPFSACAAKSEDGNWYRAIILYSTDAANDSSDRISVHYVDYGNEEEVPVANLKFLEHNFHAISAFAIKVYLPQKSIKSNEAVIKEVTTMTTNYQLSLNVLDFFKGNWIVDICYNGSSLTTELVKKELVAKEAVDNVRLQIDLDLKQKQVATPIQSHKIEASPISAGSTTISATPAVTDKLYAHISHVDSPERFYLQLVSDAPQLEMLMENIQIVAPSLQQLKDLSVNTMCIAKFSATEVWHRARIIDSDTEITTVQFIDIGNTDSITDHSLIKQMNDAFKGDKAYCIPCSLSVNSSGNGDWSDVANNILHAASKDIVHFEYISQASTKNFVNLFVDGRNLVDVLIEQGLGVAGMPIKSPEKCFVSHINSLSDFYVQFDRDSAALETFDDFLADCEKFCVLTDFVEGTICTALFEDGQWYRAKITRRQDEGALVFFVDYGNTMVATQLRALPEDIAELPHLARNCALRMPESVKKWNKDAEEKFNALAATGATIFDVDIIMAEKSAIVDLYLEGVNIIELLPKSSASANIELENQVTEITSSTSSAVQCETVDIEKINSNDVSSVSENNVELSVGAPGDMTVMNFDKVFISHSTSPQDFYIQYDHDTEGLSQMVDSLAIASCFPELEERYEGQICVAEFIEDGALYRAKILSISSDGCDVLFIDYGNCARSKNLREIPKELREIPYFAKWCSLANPRGVWNVESVSRFCEIAQASPDESFQIHAINTEVEPNIVILYKDRKCLNDELIELLGDLKISSESAEILAIVDETIRSVKDTSVNDFNKNDIEAITNQLIQMNFPTGSNHNNTPISHPSSSGRTSKEPEERSNVLNVSGEQSESSQGLEKNTDTLEVTTVTDNMLNAHQISTPISHPSSSGRTSKEPEELSNVLNVSGEQSESSQGLEQNIDTLDVTTENYLEVQKISTPISHTSSSGRTSKEPEEHPNGSNISSQLSESAQGLEQNNDVLDMTTITEHMFEAVARQIKLNKKANKTDDLDSTIDSVDSFINNVDDMIKKSQTDIHAEVMQALDGDEMLKLMNRKSLPSVADAMPPSDLFDKDRNTTV